MATIHPQTEIAPTAIIGEGSQIWHGVQIREGARLGTHCIVGRNVYIDNDVQIGNQVKIQNNAALYHGLTVEDGVFIGPQVIFTNDRVPRAIRPDGALKTGADWMVSGTHVCYGAAIGAGAIIIAGLTIGRWAMVGAGAVVTRNVADHALVVGNPARLIGYVSAGGARCTTQPEAIARSQAESG